MSSTYVHGGFAITAYTCRQAAMIARCKLSNGASQVHGGMQAWGRSEAKRSSCRSIFIVHGGSFDPSPHPLNQCAIRHSAQGVQSWCRHGKSTGMATSVAAAAAPATDAAAAGEAAMEAASSRASSSSAPLHAQLRQLEVCRHIVLQEATHQWKQLRSTMARPKVVRTPGPTAVHAKHRSTLMQAMHMEQRAPGRRRPGWPGTSQQRACSWG